MAVKSIDQNAAWKAAHDKLIEMQLALGDAEAELRKLESAAAARLRSKLDSEALRLLDGAAVDDGPVPSEEQVAKLRMEVRVRQRAIAFQEARLHKLEQQLSKEATAAALPAYHKLLAEQARVAIQLAMTIRREVELFEEYDRGGYSLNGGSTLGLQTFNDFDTGGTLAYHLVFLAQHGVLDGREEWLAGKELSKIRPAVAKAAAAYQEASKPIKFKKPERPEVAAA